MMLTALARAGRQPFAQIANYLRPATRTRTRVAEQGTLVLHYQGGDADQGQVGYYTAGSTLLAFGDLIGVLATIAYGDDAHVRTKVSRISPTGSISFEFVVITVGVVHAAQTVLMGPLSPVELWSLLKESVKAWKFLKGPPASQDRAYSRRVLDQQRRRRRNGRASKRHHGN